MLASYEIIVTGVEQNRWTEYELVSMPWKAGESLLPEEEKRLKEYSSCLNALESGRVIVTKDGFINDHNSYRLNALESGRVIVTRTQWSRCHVVENCLNALESGRVIVTDPILETGGSKARRPQIANPLS